MKVFGFFNNSDTFEILIASYSEKHRFYHTLEHIEACFKHLDTVSTQVHKLHEVELALWFHDVIYKPFSGTNEEDSAEQARLFLENNKADPECINRIYDLIILTKDHLEPVTDDGKILLDIDLSILGVESHIYEQFEINIRKEYKRVPSFMFRKKRKEILQNFLKRPRIYHTDCFFERLEVQARENLKVAIKRL